ncbi:MAG: sensor histidine kinase, partial [Candidatus Polarisedimenticolia bacterium]
INPHFLFNALHSVGALVAGDPERADRALECLGDLLRYALGTGDKVPFAQEWRFTRDYLAFEQLRLGERLRVDADADPASLSILVPPLMLQPLVENAVRHGIADRPEGGNIHLRARVDGDRLTLQVSDDGRGDAKTGSAGVGLGSVRRRLAALYGNRATLSIDSTAPGFTVCIELPLDRSHREGSAA